MVLIVSIFNNRRDVGRIIGSSVTIFSIASIVLLKMYFKSPPRFNKEYWKFGLRYSLPVVPHGISQVLLAQCDRIMITKMVSESAAGIYSLAGNLRLVLTVVSTSIGVSWSTWFFSKMDKDEMNDIQKNSSMLLRMFLILTVGLMALSPEIIYVLGGKEYDHSKYVAVPMLIDAYILFLYNIIVPSEYYTKKTKYIMMGTMVAAVINLVTNYLFVKMFGYIAAAYTTLFSYICYLLIHVVISKRLIKFEIVKWKWIVTTAAIVTFAGVFDLFFISNMILRYALCAVVIAAQSPALIRFYINGDIHLYERARMKKIARLIKGIKVKKKYSSSHRNSSIWVFGEWFGDRCCDNSKYFANYVARVHPEIEIIWISKKSTDTHSLASRIHVVEMDSDSSINYLKRCGVAIISQNFFDLSSDGFNYTGGAVSVQLWHGVPWKKIGHDGSKKKSILLNAYSLIFDYAFGTDYYVSPSEKYDRIACSAHGARRKQIIHAGYARNSEFYQYDKVTEGRNRVINELKNIAPECDFSDVKIISYMPTFRNDSMHS